MDASIRQVVAIGPLPMLLVGPDGRIRAVNAELERLFEYPPGALEGELVEMLLPEAVASRHPELRAAYARVPTKRRMGRGRDLHGRTRTGRVLPLELGLHPFEEGGETHVLVTAVDITERKRDEERVRTAIDAAASSMILVSPTGTIELVNPAAETLFGYSRDELLGASVDMLVPESVRRVHGVFRTSFVTAGVARAMGEDRAIRAVRKDGTELRVEVALTPVDEGEGRVLATIVDLSERLEAERERAERETAEAKARELLALNERLTRVAFGLSHDLKAPAVTIARLLDVALEDLEAGALDEARERIERARDRTLASQARVEKLLHLSRLGEGLVEIGEVRLEPLLRERWAHVAESASAPVPALELQLGLPSLLTHEATLAVVMDNLLSNAVRFADPMKPKPWVRITSERDGSWARVRVVDNGVGLPEGSHGRVFALFQRLHPTSGDGIGLALVQRYVGLLGGRVSCHPGEGEASTELRVELPADA